MISKRYYQKLGGFSYLLNELTNKESYNTLLYAMVNGYNRISELSAFSGYPKNKCDKYIKTLCKFGLVRKKPEKNGHTKYYPANSYIALWYETLLTAVPNSDGCFGEDVYNRFVRYFNDEMFSTFYKEMCAYWLDKNLNSISTDYIDTKNLSYRNIKIGNIILDFAYEKSEQSMPITIQRPVESSRKNSGKKLKEALRKTDRFTRMNTSSAL